MNETKIEILSEPVIVKGLQRSCESLGFFLKQDVELENVSLSNNFSIQDAQFQDAAKNKSIILYTEIIGALTGASYFLLNAEESSLLLSKNFVGMDMNDPKNKTLKEAFLLELDNIITASVVTEFSNALKIKMFGGVPQLLVPEGRGLNAVSKNTMRMASIGFDCAYKINGFNFSPKFVWYFEDKVNSLNSLTSA